MFVKFWFCFVVCFFTWLRRHSGCSSCAASSHFRETETAAFSSHSSCKYRQQRWMWKGDWVVKRLRTDFGKHQGEEWPFWLSCCWEEESLQKRLEPLKKLGKVLTENGRGLRCDLFLWILKSDSLELVFSFHCRLCSHLTEKNLPPTCWGAKWMRQRKRDQLHIFRRTLIGGQPLSFQLHFHIPKPPSDHITHPPTISSNWQKTWSNPWSAPFFLLSLSFQGSLSVVEIVKKQISGWQSLRTSGKEEEY